MSNLLVSLLTPEGEVFSQNMDQVVAPSVLGEIGILTEHIPLLADMEIGVLKFFQGSDINYYAVSGGFIDVYANKVTILAETAESSHEIDIERAQKVLIESNEKIKTISTENKDYKDILNRLKRAKTRIQVAKYSK